jgi:hypothetical protein
MSLLICYDRKNVFRCVLVVGEIFCIRLYTIGMPITGAAQSSNKTWTVFAHSNTGIVGSSPTQDMDVCVYGYSVFVLARV